MVRTVALGLVGTCMMVSAAIGQTNNSSNEFQCVDRATLQSTAATPSAISGAVGVSGSYCMGFVDFGQTINGGPALSGAKLEQTLGLTRDYDSYCNFDYGPEPMTAFRAASMQISSFGPSNMNWVEMVKSDCGKILTNLSQFMKR